MECSENEKEVLKSVLDKAVELGLKQIEERK